MKSLSVKLVLITVLLQLCLSVLEVNAGGGGRARPAAGGPVPQFGDLIEFPRAGLYSHYGIFVGGEHFDKQGANDNIFEMTGGGCRFVEKKGHLKVRNDYYNKDAQTREQMIATIKALMDPKDERCKKYSLREENCEMVATRVRYGEAECQQKGTILAGVAKKLKPRIKRQKNMQKRREASAAA
ncbi:hypothetical protein DPX16_0116 [Anabarilius grahami]|uniref:LRAT domain-containing protein n=1 Tax=Anabarilius grahami TaxID=495550 RepID=A0A3N0Y1R4_ANAGA|nr:hypothetical protein DPX16_0116 [Anabarilius grahami]